MRIANLTKIITFNVVVLSLHNVTYYQITVSENVWLKSQGRVHKRLFLDQNDVPYGHPESYQQDHVRKVFKIRPQIELKAYLETAVSEPIIRLR